MKRVYETGADSNQIKCAVKIGTVGIAYTVIYFARSGGQWTQIRESSTDSGNIKSFLLGDASILRDSYLVIRTIIDFSTIDESLWKAQAEAVVGRYYFEGGFSGAQVFNDDLDDLTMSSNGKIAVITKPIQLL